LEELGFAFRAGEYICGDKKITPSQIQTVVDDTWESFLVKTKAKLDEEAEQKKIADAKRKAELMELAEFRLMKRTKELQAQVEAAEIASFTIVIDEANTLATNEPQFVITTEEIPRIQKQEPVAAKVSLGVAPDNKHTHAVVVDEFPDAIENKTWNACVTEITQYVANTTPLSRAGLLDKLKNMLR
jgi:hypothetical protein